MQLEPGNNLGPYRIEAPIGAGGMGAVWKARDTRLDRTVAIKTIEGRFSERFEREAKTIASLNHPHICTLFDVGENYLVMEYIDGAPIQGPLPVADVTRLGAQIAEALDAAHRKGITHRDLKPGNILLTKSGVKVIDFGLAKAGPAVNLGPADATLTKPLTSEGTILGTIPYMSPEQLQGHEADARSDIFALGCVLYEMLTGKRAFDGQSQVSIMAAILEHEPAPLTEPATPAWLDRLIRRCLRKNPDDRWQSARDIAIELHEPQIASPTPPRRNWLPWSLGAAATAAALALALMRYTAPVAQTGEVTRLTIEAPDDTNLLGVGSNGTARVSPDGRSVIFLAIPSNGDPARGGGLWIRRLDAKESRPLAPDQNVGFARWSPDSRWVVYSAGSQLKKVEVAGGRIVTLLGDGGFAPAAWSRDDIILLSDPGFRGISKISASGGVPQALTRLDRSRNEVQHRAPSFLPDGRHFVYSVVDEKGDLPALFLASLDEPTRAKRIGDGFEPTFVLAGRPYLVYVRGTNLLAQPWDHSRLELTGTARPIAETEYTTTNTTLFSLSDNGVLTLLYGRLRRLFEPVWIDRTGASRAAGPVGAYRQPRLLPDGKTAVVERSESASAIFADLWTLDTERGVPSRLLGEKDRWEYHPILSPDGREFAYASNRNFAVEVIRRRFADGKENVVLPASPGVAFLGDWSRDGRYMIFASRTTIMAAAVAVQPDQRPVRLTNTAEPRERYPRISPDGKWVAFASAESGAFQVYVVEFDPSKPPSGGKFAVSTAGGDMPAWRGDGKEIFYVGPDGKMMAVPVISLAPGAPRFGAPRALFDTGIDLTMSSYDVTADGQRFLVLRPVGVRKPGSIEVVLNWPRLMEANQQ